jgi:diguanylate cyclase (GGDEF)-like protein
MEPGKPSGASRGHRKPRGRDDETAARGKLQPRRDRARRAWLLGGLACGLAVAQARAGAAETLDLRYSHRSWLHGDGLPGNSVYAIAQSADRYLWVGTENGLARFDGRRFVAYGAGPRSAFRSRLVMALLAAGDGTLWIGTERGLLQMRTGEAGPAGAPRVVVPDAAVSALAENLRGDLWIGTRSGLLRRSAASGVTREIGLRGTRVTALLAGDAGELWVGTEDRGAWLQRGGRLLPVELGRQTGQETVTGLLQDKDGATWVFTRKASYRVPAGDEASAGRAATAVDNVVAAAGGPHGSWLGTADRGPVRIAGGRRWLASSDHPLANAIINQVFVADDGTAWFGTSGDGLHQLAERAATTYTRREGLSNEGAASVWVDQDRTVWSGTLDGLNQLVRGGRGALSVHAELRGVEVASVLRDSRGVLWAGTSRGLARRVGSRWEFLPPWDGAATRVVGALREDRHGDLWVGTAGGLGVVRGVGGLPNDSPRRVAAVPGLAGQEITGLAEADDGALWIGTRGAGLLRLRDGRLTMLLSGLDVPIVTGMRRGRVHDMWVGTFGTGLLHYRAGRWHRIDESNGLSDDTVRQVIEDAKGDVWICSAAGISRLTRSAIADLEAGRAASLLPFNYGPEDGVADGVCHGGSEPGAVRGADGELWFGTTRGLVEVHPETLASPLPGRGPRLDGAVVDGRELALQELFPLRISAQARRLDLHFSFPAFVAQRRAALRYRLVGIDPSWIAGDGEGLARYTSLPPAHYRFEVALRDGRGGWQRPVGLAEIAVEPLFYQRGSVQALVALLLAAAAAALLRARELSQRRRAALLEGQIQQRTEELRQANEQLGILAVADPLTNLANRRKLEENLAAETRRCARSRSEISLIMIDVDHFKAYNDSLGHVAGDDCLRRVAAALRGGVMRTADLVARYGGEEFAVLLPELSGQEALRVAERLRQSIQDLAIPHPGLRAEGSVTISAGVAAIVPGTGLEADFSPLVEEADEALYRAKSNGRNRVQVSHRVAAELPAWERRLLAWAGPPQSPTESTAGERRLSAPDRDPAHPSVAAAAGGR